MHAFVCTKYSYLVSFGFLLIVKLYTFQGPKNEKFCCNKTSKFDNHFRISQLR